MIKVIIKVKGPFFILVAMVLFVVIGYTSCQAAYGPDSQMDKGTIVANTDNQSNASSFGDGTTSCSGGDKGYYTADIHAGQSLVIALPQHALQTVGFFSTAKNRSAFNKNNLNPQYEGKPSVLYWQRIKSDAYALIALAKNVNTKVPYQCLIVNNSNIQAVLAALTTGPSVPSEMSHAQVQKFDDDYKYTSPGDSNVA